MNWSVKLAKSLLKDKTLHRHHFIQQICQAAIALCITTILISSFLIRGFESKIEDKIFEFWSHIRITSLSNSTNSITENPLQLNIKQINNPNITKLVPVVNKGVILKSKNNIEGIILKGIPKDRLPAYSQDSNETFLPIVLSEQTMAKLNVEKGSIFYVNIIDSVPLTLKAKVVASYFTNIDEFDNQIALTDIKILQELNHWAENEYSWVEVSVDHRDQIILVANTIYHQLSEMNVETIFSIFPQLFDWLALMKRNELIIFIVMTIVAMVNIISFISIFIIEKTKLIGMLKVLGARNNQLYEFIFYQVARIILKGIIIGNIITLVLTAILHYLKPIKLDPTTYYVSYAPVQFDLVVFIVINWLTIMICLITAWIPIKAISKISPIKVVEHQ